MVLYLVQQSTKKYATKWVFNNEANYLKLDYFSQVLFFTIMIAIRIRKYSLNDNLCGDSIIPIPISFFPLSES
ncbi:hypothetical protein A9Q75_12965 [Colwellia psychrerythraea]|uniref:Uncharacterized protein n=1 Tax=Colwellia psychrerythraea TaxID=28229 RepID=A0A1Y5EDZ8_COLPS|nr:hypothetical protein A9Q75_12965 [Colwellia psychrerythraea]